MKTVILGLDAFDPNLFEQFYDQGGMPHLGQIVQANGYRRFSVANPPQSEVSWTSIATGLNPGGHGLFDFVHRDPATYRLTVSLLPTSRGALGTQFVRPSTARTMFDQAVRDGFPATVLWWPATFPAQPGSPVATIPGLGTPDIFGRLGVGTLFSSGGAPSGRVRRSKYVELSRSGRSTYRGHLPLPAGKKKGSAEPSLPLELVLNGEKTAVCRLGRHLVNLALGEWSPVLEIDFKSGLLFSLKAVTRLILTQTTPEVRLYVLPLQLHPLRSPWHYGAPRPFIARVWKSHGPFLTLGWPQDTVGLEDGCIDDSQFLDLCRSILATREAILFDQLDRFRDGLLAVVFDSLDRIQHMFWRSRPDVIRDWYMALDALVGRVRQHLERSGKDDCRLIIVSDHGFSEFNYKVHLNRWLVQKGFLQPSAGREATTLDDVDWKRSRAYALGLNSVYLNRIGREGQGCVSADEAAGLSLELRRLLLDWSGPDGRSVVQNVWTQTEAFEGPLTGYAPDLVVGYAPGFRASAETGLGQWPDTALETNHDHWSGDHCIDPAAVPGVLFASDGLSDFPRPSYKDIPALALGRSVDQGHVSPPPFSDEDQELVEARLRELGYL